MLGIGLLALSATIAVAAECPPRSFTYEQVRYFDPSIGSGLPVGGHWKTWKDHLEDAGLALAQAGAEREWEKAAYDFVVHVSGLIDDGNEANTVVAIKDGLIEFILYVPSESEAMPDGGYFSESAAQGILEEFRQFICWRYGVPAGKSLMPLTIRAAILGPAIDVIESIGGGDEHGNMDVFHTIRPVDGKPVREITVVRSRWGAAPQSLGQ